MAARLAPLGLLVGLAAACRSPAAAPVEPWGLLDPCGPAGAQGDRADLDEAALGAALAYTAEGAPRDLDALAALVGAHAGGAPVELIAGASGSAVDPVEVAAAALGRPACRRPVAGRVIVEGPGSDGSGAVARRVPASEVTAARLAVAARHLEAGEDAEARTALQSAAAHEPAPIPGTLLAIGDSYARAGRWSEAQAFYVEASLRFPHVASGWAGLGRTQREGRRRLASLAASARALALFPGDRATRAVMAEDPFISLLPPLAPPAVPTGQPGRWRMVAPATSASSTTSANPFLRAEALAYAGCREAFRRSPELRRRLAGRDVPAGRWSPAEETACTLMWLRAYLGHRGQARDADAGLDDLIEVAREGLLDERALHDVAGLADPRVLWLISEGRRKRVFQFVERHRVMTRGDMGILSPF